MDGALWRHIWPWRLVAVGWPEGGQMALIPQYHFIVADLSSENHPILIRSVTKLCVMLYSTQIDDGGAELWHNRLQRPLPARGGWQWYQQPARLGRFHQEPLGNEFSHWIWAVAGGYCQD